MNISRAEVLDIVSNIPHDNNLAKRGLDLTRFVPSRGSKSAAGSAKLDAVKIGKAIGDVLRKYKTNNAFSKELHIIVGTTEQEEIDFTEQKLYEIVVVLYLMQSNQWLSAVEFDALMTLLYPKGPYMGDAKKIRIQYLNKIKNVIDTHESGLYSGSAFKIAMGKLAADIAKDPHAMIWSHAATQDPAAVKTILVDFLRRSRHDRLFMVKHKDDFIKAYGLGFLTFILRYWVGQNYTFMIKSFIKTYPHIDDKIIGQVVSQAAFPGATGDVDHYRCEVLIESMLYAGDKQKDLVRALTPEQIHHIIKIEVAYIIREKYGSMRSQLKSFLKMLAAQGIAIPPKSQEHLLKNGMREYIVDPQKSGS